MRGAVRAGGVEGIAGRRVGNLACRVGLYTPQTVTPQLCAMNAVRLDAIQAIDINLVEAVIMRPLYFFRLLVDQPPRNQAISGDIQGILILVLLDDHDGMPG